MNARQLNNTIARPVADCFSIKRFQHNLFEHLKPVLLLLLLGSISACSFKTIYSHLDLIIPVYIDNLVDLDELEDRVDEKVVELLAWHQKEQLPVYSDWLQESGSLVLKRKKQPLTEQAIIRQFNKLTEIYQPLRVKINKEMAWLLPLFNDEQIDELFNSLEQENNDYIQEHVSLTADEKHQVYIERMYKQFEHWTGYLTDQQKQLIDESARKFKSLAKKRLNARIQWQQTTRKFLLEKPEALPEKLFALFEQLAEEQKKKFSEINLSNQQHLAKIILKILATLEEQQENNIRQKLDYYNGLIHEFRQHHWK